MINNPKYYVAHEQVSKGLGHGIVSIPSDPELIPQHAAQDSLGWISTDGQIELCKGRLLLGTEETSSGSVEGHGFGYKYDGTAVQFRKIGTKIQYYNTTSLVWVDIVTGLTAGKEYTVSRYQSPAGTFVYFSGYDGIYKIHTANPASYSSVYLLGTNYKAKSMIGTGRMFMWDIAADKTGLHLSWIDKQDSSVYTTVAPEATTSLSGTLAFKAAGARRTCFAIAITITASGEIFTDNYLGILTGTLGGTGTINYTTGAYTLSNAGVGTAVYSWEDSSVKGITDFTHSATRLAGEGDTITQDEGGDAIQNVIIYENKIYSLKSASVYELTISSTPPYVDLSYDNKVFRKDVGITYWRAVVATGKGVMFMSTSNLSKPQLTILQKNINGDNLVPVTLANHFDFSGYIWDDCAMTTFDEFVVFSGRTSTSTINNRLFIYNLRRDTVDVLPYSATTIISNAGLLYIGDASTYNVYQILTGFDDDNQTIENYWISNDDRYGTENLKKVKKLRFKGLITPGQHLEVYVSYDGDAPTLVGTVRGNGTYVDPTQSYTIGAQGIGTTVIGGETSTVKGNLYLAELKLATPKFRKRSIKLKAIGLGYVSVNFIDDFNIRTFEQRIPKKYRSRQNVNLAGTLTNL